MSYIAPADARLFKLGKKELQTIASGKSKDSAAAQAELDRRKANRAAKRAA
jgi:hypothetical protein